MVSPTFPGLEDSLPEWQTQANDTVDLREWARREAARLGVPESHGLGTLLHESGLDAAAMQNPATWGNGGGVGQFLEDTARSYGTTQEELRANPRKAVTTALQLLKDNADQFGGDYDKAAAAYFIGAGNIRQAERLGGDNWRAYADQLAAQYGQGTVSDYLSSALGQHLSTGTTAPVPASSGYATMSTTRRGTPGVTEEQPVPIADQLEAARQRRMRDVQNLAATANPVTGQVASAFDTSPAPAPFEPPPTAPATPVMPVTDPNAVTAQEQVLVPQQDAFTPLTTMRLPSSRPFPEVQPPVDATAGGNYGDVPVATRGGPSTVNADTEAGQTTIGEQQLRQQMEADPTAAVDQEKRRLFVDLARAGTFGPAFQSSFTGLSDQEAQRRADAWVSRGTYPEVINGPTAETWLLKNLVLYPIATTLFGGKIGLQGALKYLGAGAAANVTGPAAEAGLRALGAPPSVQRAGGIAAGFAPYTIGLRPNPLGPTSLITGGAGALAAGGAGELYNQAGGPEVPFFGNPAAWVAAVAIERGLGPRVAAGVDRVAAGLQEQRAAARAFRGEYPADWTPADIARYEAVKADVLGQQQPPSGPTAAPEAGAEVGRYRTPGMQGQPVGGGAPTPAEEAGGGPRRLPAGGDVGADIIAAAGPRGAGLPPGITTPEQMAQRIDEVHKMAQAGAPARFWYDRSGSAMRDTFGAGSSPEATLEAAKFAFFTAATSPRNNVKGQGSFMLKAWQQYQDGEPIKVHFPDQNARMNKVAGFKTAEELGNYVVSLLKGSEGEGGRKTMNFFLDHLDDIDPEWAAQLRERGGATTTVDMHMARAFGYSSDAVTPAQYNVIEKGIAEVARREGWTNKQAQAAIWATQKSIFESARSGKPVTVGDTGFDYKDSLERHLAGLNIGTEPRQGSPLRSAYDSQPPEEKAAYQKDLADALLNDGGRDYLGDVMRVPQSPEGYNQVYVGASNGELEPGQARQIGDYMATKAYLLGQPEATWVRPFFDASKGKHNGVDLAMGRPATPEEVASLKADLGKGFFVQATPRGAWAWKEAGDAKVNAATRKAIVDAVGRSWDNQGTAEVRSFATQGETRTNDYERNPNGEDYRQGNRALNRPAVREAVGQLQQRIAAVHGAYLSKWQQGAGVPGESALPAAPAGEPRQQQITPQQQQSEQPVNFEDVKAKFLRAAQEERNARATGSINRQIREGRSAQAGGVRAAAQQGGSLEELGRNTQGAMYQGGTLRKTFLKPISLTPADEQAVADTLSQMVEAGDLSPFDLYRFVAPATSANPGIIARLTSETPRLQPAEVRLIRRVFGDEIANVAQERSDLSLEPRMTDLQERRLIETIAREEVRVVARADAEAVKAQVQANLKQARAQETKDNRDIAAANRERERAIRAEAAAAEDEMRGNMRALDAMTKKLVTDERLTLEEENAANMRALNAMTARQYRDARAEFRANHKAMLALWDRSYEGIYAKALTVATKAGGPDAGEIIKYQLQGNREILDRLHSPEGLARIALTTRAAFTGDLADSYLTALQRRTEQLRGAFVYDGMDPEIAGKVATAFRDAELTRRYPGGLPEATKQMLAEMKGPAYGDSWGALDKLIQRWKNTVFSTDFGVVGTQLKAAVDRGSVSGIAGYVNRVLTMLNLPHAELYSTEVNLPRKVRDILDGVYVGSAPSAVQPSEGTLFSYITPYLGKPGELFDKGTAWLMDKGNQIQFRGILGHARDVSYEGNLFILKMLGRDTENARVRKTAADFANATTLFAQTALNRTRAGWEKRILTSAPMMRSEVANILQMAKFFEPTASAEERILAGTAILSRLVAVLLVGKFLNDTLGQSDYVMNPFAKGFGQVVTGIKDKSGRNVVISMFPQESLVKAFGKAVVALADSDPKKAGEVLLQGISGRFSLPAQLVENVAGFGYDADGRFHTGDLHLGLGGVLKKSFSPPIGQQYMDDPSSAYLAAQSIGVSAFPESTGSLRDRRVQDEGLRNLARQKGETIFGDTYATSGPILRSVVDATPEVAASKAETPSEYTQTRDQAKGELDALERKALDAFKAGENKQKITDIWHDLGQRRLQLSIDLGRQFKDFFAGFNETQYDKAVQGYYDINATFKDGTPDFDATDKQRSEYLSKLPADQQAWVNESIKVTATNKSPERQQYDRYIDAKKKLGYFDIDPKDPQANAKRAALDAANPEIDVASWYYSGTSDQAGAAVSSPAAADKALGLNLPNRPVKISGYSRPVNESPKVREVYNGTKRFISDYEAALTNPANLDLAASDLYDTRYLTLNDSQKQAVRTRISTSLQRQDPQLDAVLAFFGKSESLYSEEAFRFLDQMVSHAQLDPRQDKILQKVRLPAGAR